ncbi:hypothetical protein TraAM80_07819 [Trypanosoma rangeli]|uniref:Uncharacterized protein n=1 Tax=Trypanosoma rangeli TaxID=5698 RepID=A0A3R7KRT9_TRYRA|nr:uncharacterized protein TraAM80_07819 [Trypanosoma rangeli]RNF00077.1 hypothetical protein TraAM80_07819 [Trypanosoma rangeli]|eukprot:RNF00077.1 hypothetical protein TraAM80_07819 [Trypanosoma rangeli]
MKRQTYTREELLALRGTLALGSFLDPVPLDCPMRTDSDLTLLQTTVRKRKKEHQQRMPVLQRSAADSGAVGETDDLTRVNNLRSGLKELSIALGNPNRAGEYADTEERRHTVLMPPRLQTPFVVIDAKRRHRNVASVDYEKKTEVNVDAERMLVARLRLRQRAQQAERPPSTLVEEPPQCEERSAGSVVFATSPPTEMVAASRATWITAAEPVQLKMSALQHLEAGTAVPVLNFSLFNSAFGSRYLHFTRSLGLWHYLSGALGTRYPHFLGHDAGARPRAGDTSNSTSSCSPNGKESSIGLDDSETMPVGGEKSDSDIAAALKKKRPHRRRTNRTHAEKREHRQLQQIRAGRTDNGGCGV